MSKLLYLQASPRGPRSKSIAVADAFVDAYRQSHPADEVETLNVFEADLPPFHGLALEAKYAILHGQQHTQEQLQAWKAVEAIIERFKSADKYVLAVPMWNFGIPYRLKQYLDILVQPGSTFSYDPAEGYKGLVVGKPIFTAYARGGEYTGSEVAPFDLQKRYMEIILGFIGFADLRSVVLEPTLAGGPEVAQSRLSAAIAQARQMAREF